MQIKMSQIQSWRGGRETIIMDRCFFLFIAIPLAILIRTLRTAIIDTVTHRGCDFSAMPCNRNLLFILFRDLFTTRSLPLYYYDCFELLPHVQSHARTLLYLDDETILKMS